MIIRALIRFWRWMRTPTPNVVSDDWMKAHVARDYEDNPRAQSKR